MKQFALLKNFSLISCMVFAVNANLKVQNLPELNEALTEVFPTTSTSGWILLNFAGPSTIEFIKSGNGTTQEFINYLEDDQIQYVKVRITVNEVGRNIFINWIGPNVGIIEKGKKLAYLGDAEALLGPLDGSSITVMRKQNFNDNNVFAKSFQSSNSRVID